MQGASGSAWLNGGSFFSCGGWWLRLGVASGARARQTSVCKSTNMGSGCLAHAQGSVAEDVLALKFLELWSPLLLGGRGFPLGGVLRRLWGGWCCCAWGRGGQSRLSSVGVLLRFGDAWKP